MSINNNFINAEFLKIENINKSKEILKKTFLIDFEKCDWLDQEFLEAVADPGDYYDETFLDISLNEWLKKIHKQNDCDYSLYKIYKLHRASVSILRNYTISLKDYFPNVEYEDYRLPEIEQYMFNNMKLNLSIFKKLSSMDDEYIDLKSAVLEYIKFNKFFKDIELRETLISGQELDKPSINSLYTKFKGNLQKLIKEDAIVNKYSLYKQLSDNIEINKATSNVLLYTLDVWEKFLYNEKNYKSITYNDTKKFFEEFLKSDINIIDLFLFEKLYSIYYKLYGYMINYSLYINEKLSEIEEQILKDSLIEIVQLPNWIESAPIIEKMMSISSDISNFDSFENYKEQLKKVCIHLNYYVIPLYNMVFSNMLNCYCNANNISIEKFLKEYLKDEEILQEYKNKYAGLYKIESVQKRKIEKDGGITKLVEEIRDRENNYRFYSSNLIDKMGMFGEKIEDAVSDKYSYQSNLKKFILNGIIN